MGIGLKTVINTLDTTTHQLTRSTGLLSERFKTDKDQLRHKHISSRYVTFYVDYLKVVFNSVRQFIGGNLYTEKLGFNIFLPCSNDALADTGNTLRGFIEIFGLPPTLYSYNHENFKEVLFKILLRKFGIIPTYTEPHLTCHNRS